MGCSSSSGGGSSSKAPPPTQEIVPELRRRLSLGELGPEDGPAGDCKPLSDQDRSLLVQLTQQQIFDFLAADKQAARRYSIGSQTDQDGHLVNSFSSKMVKLDGTHFDASGDHIGYACKKGLKPEAPNQDSFLIMKVEDQHAIYGVFDGHGRQGHDVSNFVKENLPKILLSQESFVDDPSQALLKSFEKTQYLLERATAMNTIDATRSGTTCSLVLHCIPEKMLYIAHVGDSRVVLGKQKRRKDAEDAWEAVDCTVDHKPELPEERARIEKAGGIVIFDGGWNYRVFAKDKIDSRGKRYPGLNMSRAMGDLNGFNDAGISAVPDVNRHVVETPHASKDDHAQQTAADAEKEETDFGSILSSSSNPSVSSCSIDPDVDKFILLCSDGVWEFISSEEAVKETAKFGEASQASEHLAALAWDRWMREMDGQVVDDITALVVHFQ